MNKIYKEYLQNGVIDEDNAVDIIEEQQKEIERLKKQSNNYAKRIIKAIEYIETQWKKESYYDDIDNCLKQMLITEYDKDDLLEILKGEDNE